MPVITCNSCITCITFKLLYSRYSKQLFTIQYNPLCNILKRLQTETRMVKQRSLLSLLSSVQTPVPKQVTYKMPPGKVWFLRNKSMFCKGSIDLLYKETNWCEGNSYLSPPHLSSRKHKWHLLSQALWKSVLHKHFIGNQRINSEVDEKVL